MKNWNTSSVAWNSNQIKAYDGEHFLTYYKKSFYVDLPNGVEPKISEAILFLIAKKYSVHDVRFVSATPTLHTTRHVFEAFVCKETHL